MTSHNSRLVFLAILTFSNLSISFGETKKYFKPEEFRTTEDVAKKYRIPFPKDPSKWEAPKDLSNFKEVSTDTGIKLFRPDCFKVELLDEDDINLLKKSLAFNLVKTEKCSNPENNFNLFAIQRKSDSEGLSSGVASYLVYKEPFLLNSNNGLLEVQVGLTSEPVSKESAPNISYRVGFECKIGKSKYYYHARINVPSGEASWKLLEARNYSLPKEVKEILSTFKCVKPKIKYP